MRPQPPPRRSPEREKERVPLPIGYDFGAATAYALDLAEQGAYEPYVRALSALADCFPATAEPLIRQETRGATYKQLAAIGYAVGMSTAERVEWYRIAERIPLSQRHAGHIIARMGAA